MAAITYTTRPSVFWVEGIFGDPGYAYGYTPPADWAGGDQDYDTSFVYGAGGIGGNGTAFLSAEDVEDPSWVDGTTQYVPLPTAKWVGQRLHVVYSCPVGVYFRVEDNREEGFGSNGGELWPAGDLQVAVQYGDVDGDDHVETATDLFAWPTDYEDEPSSDVTVHDWWIETDVVTAPAAVPHRRIFGRAL
jgi:hypothetical protein